jgi:hypothetical protein
VLTNALGHAHNIYPISVFCCTFKVIYLKMDAKNIFIACNHYSGAIKWMMTEGNEWNYIGVGDDYNESKVNELIGQHFSDAEIYVVIDRHHSFLIQTKTAASSIRELLNKNGLMLSSKEFTKMMVFNNIGVVKYGERA